jgi:D-arabinose 1-dehydrogenase-like Zn-dependent alcohol dehydrogenase
MLAARMHDYKQPLVLEDIKVADILPDQVLVKVGEAGMCRSDVQLIDGYFAETLKVKFPITPGHEIAGLVAALGDRGPESSQLAIGGQVVAAAGWGDGICRQCRLGTARVFVSVGLVGTRIDIPLFPFTAGELTYHGSFWANYSDLQEVLALAPKGKIQHSIKRVRFEDINENLELLRAGDIIGRAVVEFDVDADSSNRKSEKEAVAV